MGLRADIYISRDDEAVSYDTTPDQFADRAQYKGFTPCELSILWSIMRGVEWDVAMMDEFPCLLQIGGGERLIHRLPSEMVTELATLSPDQVVSVSSAWAATEELGWPQDSAREVIEDLVHLSRRATETSRSLYLWNCV
jgi:hypothetical protein